MVVVFCLNVCITETGIMHIILRDQYIYFLEFPFQLGYFSPAFGQKVTHPAFLRV